jgi:hypothetical protein
MIGLLSYCASNVTGGKNHFVVHSILNHGTVRSYGRWSVPNWIPILWMPSELQSIYNPTSMCFMCKACHIYKSGQQRLFCVTPLFVVTTTACVYLHTSPAPRPTHTPCTTHPWWSKTGVHHSQTSFTTCRQVSDNLHCSPLLADFTHHSQCNTTTQTTCW